MVKKTTERKRIKRMQKDCARLYMHDLISAAAADSINKRLKAAMRKTK